MIRADVVEMEGDERYVVVQLKFRERVLSELGKIGNKSFHRVKPPNVFCLFGRGAQRGTRCRKRILAGGKTKVNDKEKIIA